MWRAIICLVLLLSPSVIGEGTAGERKAPRPQSREPQRSYEERVLRGVLTIYIWKMTEAVGLTEEQAAQVFPKIREAFRTRWESAAKRRDLLQLLQRKINALRQKDNGLVPILTEWEENEAKRYGAQQEMREALTRVLTPAQQAKSLLFEERFQGDLVKVIREINRERVERSRQQRRSQEP